MLANRLRKRQRHLRKWARRREVTCYRLYERDIPDFPLIVDWYDGEAVAWIYRRKKDETPDQEKAFGELAIGEILDGLELPPDKLFLKRRQRQRGLDQYDRVDERGQVRLVAEQGLRFEVNLSDYLDTGLFLDHRSTRAMVREEAAGKRFLNLFAYTGTFTCYAIDGGAASTMTVDMSRTYCDWARRNLAHNSQAEGENHRVIQADVLVHLERLASDGAMFDLIVCDPPTFSNSKRMQVDSFSVDRDHPMLIEACNRVLAPGGVLFFSTNSRRFELEETALPRELDVREISGKTVPEDLRNARIHRCWRMMKRL
jgi:23S rRNA (cytosine1962-C5)-methyltransferase